MDVLEIVLLIAGAVIFALGFILPVRQESISNGIKRLARAEIKELVSEEMDEIKEHVDDMVEETVTYAMEKTERSLERLSNEKIMAVSEYSDTVLQEINRNHNEVMFLYDMLNDKHQNIKNTVQEVNKSVKEVTETKKEAEAMVSSFQRLTPTVAAPAHIVPVAEEPVMPEVMVAEPAEPHPLELFEMVQESTEPVKEPGVTASNCNEQILELYKQGMDKVDIARMLSLGVGEVKLVIDLYKNM